MAIITTQEELKTLLRGRAQAALTLDNVAEFIDEVTRDIIIPAMSQAEYDALQTAYDAVTPPTLPAAPYDVLLPYVQKATALYALVKFKNETLTTTGNAGTKETGDDTTMPARQWVFNTEARSRITSADGSLELLLNFLEQNATTYTDWASSESRIIRTELLVSNAAVLSQTGKYINTRTAYQGIRNFLVDAEVLTIRKKLGNNYYNELIAQARDNTLTPENEVIYNLAQKASAYEATSKAAIAGSLSQNQNGSLYTPIIEDGNRKDTEAPNEKLVQLGQQYHELSCEYINELKGILDTSADGQYSTYKAQTDVYTPPPTPEELELREFDQSQLKTFGF